MAKTESTQDDRSPYAIGFEWSSRITGISITMLLPAWGGYWLDQQLGTRAVFLIIGMVLGFTLGMLNLLKIAKQANSRPVKNKIEANKRSDAHDESSEDVSPKP